MLADNLALVQKKIMEALAKRTEPKATGSVVTVVAVTRLSYRAGWRVAWPLPQKVCRMPP